MYKYNYVYVILYGANYKNIKKTCFMILFFDRLHVLNLRQVEIFAKKDKSYVPLHSIYVINIDSLFI